MASHSDTGGARTPRAAGVDAVQGSATTGGRRWSLYRTGTFLLELTDTGRGIAYLALAMGALGALAETCIHTAIRKLGLPEWAAIGLDAFGLGTVLAIVTIFEARAARERRMRVFTEIKKVGALNHEVRNALAAIRYAAHFPPSADYMAIIIDSVTRIDQTLATLFPAIIGPHEPLRKPPQSVPEVEPTRKMS